MNNPETIVRGQWQPTNVEARRQLHKIETTVACPVTIPIDCPM